MGIPEVNPSLVDGGVLATAAALLALVGDQTIAGLDALDVQAPAWRDVHRSDLVGEAAVAVRIDGNVDDVNLETGRRDVL